MTDKPEIQRYKYGYKDDGCGQRYLALIEDPEGSVVRLTDHEASRAADKARIAELTMNADNMIALFADIAKVLGHDFPDCVDNDGQPYQSQYLADLIALAQQGKEGGE